MRGKRPNWLKLPNQDDNNYSDDWISTIPDEKKTILQLKNLTELPSTELWNALQKKVWL